VVRQSTDRARHDRDHERSELGRWSTPRAASQPRPDAEQDLPSRTASGPGINIVRNPEQAKLLHGIGPTLSSI
jgi:hypothetical protein